MAEAGRARRSRVDEPLVELETDKVTLEVPAPAAGTLAEIVAEEGANVPVGAVLGPDQRGCCGGGRSPRPDPRSRERRIGDPGETREGDRRQALERAGPAVRKLVAESGVDVATIAPTGPGDRITKADVLEALARPVRASGLRHRRHRRRSCPRRRPPRVSARCGCG